MSNEVNLATPKAIQAPNTEPYCSNVGQDREHLWGRSKSSKGLNDRPETTKSFKHPPSGDGLIDGPSSAEAANARTKGRKTTAVRIPRRSHWHPSQPQVRPREGEAQKNKTQPDEKEEKATSAKGATGEQKTAEPPPIQLDDEEDELTIPDG